MYAALPAGSGLVSGQMITLSVEHPATVGGLTVPTKAVVHMDGQSVVFVERSGGFSVRSVTVRGKTPVLATIEGDVKSGERVAVSGLAQLERMANGD
jgi:hypothetical protein